MRNLHLSRKKGMFLLDMNGLESLEKLLQLKDSDIIKLDTLEIPYGNFKEKFVEKADAIYISTEAYIRKETDYLIGTHVPKELVEDTQFH